MSSQESYADLDDDFEDDIDTDAGGADDDDEGSAGGTDDGEGEFEISFDGEEPSTPRADESQAIKQMRKKIEEQARELAQRPKPVEKLIDPGPKPTLEGCDYDEAKFEAAMDSWHDNKRAAEVQGQERQRQAEQVEQRWQQKQQTFAQRKAALKVPDFDEASDIATTSLDAIKVGIIVTGAEDSAKVMYALGKSPAKLAELAKISDPIEFAFAVARMEGKITMKPKRSGAPEPDERVRGSAPISTRGPDKKEAALEAKADKTGNRDELLAYRRAKREASAARR